MLRISSARNAYLYSYFARTSNDKEASYRKPNAFQTAKKLHLGRCHRCGMGANKNSLSDASVLLERSF